jgi:hypothetical protein
MANFIDGICVGGVVIYDSVKVMSDSNTGDPSLSLAFVLQWFIETIDFFRFHGFMHWGIHGVSLAEFVITNCDKMS